MKKRFITSLESLIDEYYRLVSLGYSDTKAVLEMERYCKKELLPILIMKLQLDVKIKEYRR